MELQNAVQPDPFIQCLLAQCYEKLGNRAVASEYYGKAAKTTAHSVPATFARPFAKTKLQEGYTGFPWAALSCML